MAASTGKKEIEEGVSIPKHVQALETALRILHAALATAADAPASEADLRPIAFALGRSIVAVTGGFDGARDPLLGVRDGMVALDEARAGLERASVIDPPLGEIVAWLDNARGWLLVAEERHSRVIPFVLEPSRLMGTLEEPRLHHIPRAPLGPYVKVVDPKTPAPPPPPRIERKKPTSIGELEAQVAEIQLASDKAKIERAARLMVRLKHEELRRRKPILEEPPPGFVSPRSWAISSDAFIRARCRECFEEIAMVGMQRAPLLGDPWRTASFLERRMLAAIDAIASLGTAALASLEPLIFDAPAKDPSRGFAITMIAGCFVGRDTLAAAERALRHLGPSDPEVRRNVAGALKLVPHPDLANMLRAWSTDSDPGIRAIAIDVLSYRGLATPDEILRAARDPEPVVAAVGILAAGVTRVDELDELVAKTIEDDDPALREATYLAMVLGGSIHAADRVERELSGPFEERALVPLALGASLRHAETIAERLELGVTKIRALAAGWAGSPRAFPALLNGLDSENPEIALACALALDRITGAGLAEQVDLPPEQIDVDDDVDDPDMGEPEPEKLARKISDPRDLPSDGSPDRMILPTVRRSRWEEYFAREPSRYLPQLRYRRGQPYSPNTVFVELDRFPLLAQERRNLHRELIIRTGEVVKLDPHDFVVVQERALPEWAPHANRASSIPGSWSRPARARR